jgi:hypothetical protein
VTFSVIRQRGRLPGIIGWIEDRFAFVATSSNAMVEKQTSYTDIDEARAGAERLAEERAQADV